MLAPGEELPEKQERLIKKMRMEESYLQEDWRDIENLNKRIVIENYRRIKMPRYTFCEETTIMWRPGKRTAKQV